MSHAPRIAPAEAPYPEDIQARFDAILPPGMAPLVLFRMLARDARLFSRFTGGSLLDKGHLTLRQREVVIFRVTARSGSTYEWGVHAAFFAKRIGFTDEHLHSIARGTSKDACWDATDAVLIDLVDSLHDTCDVDDALWQRVRAVLGEEAIMELLLLAGFYRSVSYLTNVLRLPPESFARAFPD